MTSPSLISEQLQAHLRNGVLSGELPPGTRLKEVQLAERFRVGRAALRDAFKQLVLEGLLVARPNCGVNVALPAGDLVREALTPVRQTLETYALRHWFARREPMHFEAWEQVLGRMRKACLARDHSGIINEDILFHEMIFKHAGLSELQVVWHPTMMQLRDYHVERNHRYKREDLLAIHQIHVELLKLFQGTSVERAEKALASHVTDGSFNREIKARLGIARPAQQNGRSAKR